MYKQKKNNTRLSKGAQRATVITALLYKNELKGKIKIKQNKANKYKQNKKPTVKKHIVEKYKNSKILLTLLLYRLDDSYLK